MRYIDVFCHYFPEAFWNRILHGQGMAGAIGKRMKGITALHDIETRLKIVDHFPDYSQVLSIGLPPLEALAGPEDSPELARLVNDGMAELCRRYPQHFVGWVAALPMNNPEAAVREARRCFEELGGNGVQLHTNVGGAPLDEPRFEPVFRTCADADKPVLLHPIRSPAFPDYVTEDKSKYEIWAILGWPYETSVAMARMVFSGMIDRMPNLRVVTHHLGAMAPFFGERLTHGWDELGSRTVDEDYVTLRKNLKKRPGDYFRENFWGDTALAGGRPGIACGLEYFGPDHVLFASDCPFDPEGGYGYIRHTIAALESIPLDDEARAKVSWRNAHDMLKLKA